MRGRRDKAARPPSSNACRQAYAYMHTIVHGYMHSTKKKKKKKKNDGEIDSASLDVPLLFCKSYKKIATSTSKTLQSLLHSLKATIDEVSDNAFLRFSARSQDATAL